MVGTVRQIGYLVDNIRPRPANHPRAAPFPTGAAMSPDELQARFLSEIEKRAVDDKYIDGIEERELLQIAIQHGFGTEWARTFLADVCRRKGYVIEASVVQLIRDRVRAAARADGTIDRTGFEQVVEDARRAVAGTTRTDRDVRALVVTTLEDAGPARVRAGFFTNWYARMKKELGLR